MKTKKFAKGKIICKDGSKGTEMFIIRKGSVRVFKMFNDEKVELGIIHENDIFGEMSLLLDSHRTASIEAIEDSELIILNKKSVIQRIKSEPEFAIVMLTRLATRVTQAHEVIAGIHGDKRSLKLMYGDMIDEVDTVLDSML